MSVTNYKYAEGEPAFNFVMAYYEMCGFDFIEIRRDITQRNPLFVFKDYNGNEQVIDIHSNIDLLKNPKVSTVEVIMMINEYIGCCYAKSRN
jgi:hypothetical protein